MGKLEPGLLAVLVGRTRETTGVRSGSWRSCVCRLAGGEVGTINSTPDALMDIVDMIDCDARLLLYGASESRAPRESRCPRENEGEPCPTPAPVSRRDIA